MINKVIKVEMLQNSSLPKKKLVTIGDAQAGKTSLLWRLTHKQRPNIQEATIGAAFFNSSSKKYCLNMWDTAGQERFRSMLPIYLRDAEIILFVYDITDRSSYDHLQKYWINFALTHSSTQSSSQISQTQAKKTSSTIEIPLKRSMTLPTLPGNTNGRSMQYGTSPSQYGTSPSQYGTSPSQFRGDVTPNYDPRQQYSGNFLRSNSVKNVATLSVPLTSMKTSTKRKNEAPFCFVIANKSDLHKERIVTKEEGEQLAQSINAVFIELSALTGSNTDKIFQVLDSQLDIDLDVTLETPKKMQTIFLDDNQQTGITKLFGCCGN